MAASTQPLPDWFAAELTPAQLGLSKAMLWRKLVVLPDMPLTSTERLVALTLSTFMSAEGEARPSLTTLAQGAALGRNTVALGIRTLTDLRVLQRVSGGPHRANRYQAIVPAECPLVGRQATYVGRDTTYQTEDETPSVGREPTQLGRHTTQVGRETGIGRSTRDHEVDFEVATEGAIEVVPAPDGAPGHANPKMQQRVRDLIARGHEPDSAQAIADREMRNAS